LCKRAIVAKAIEEVLELGFEAMIVQKGSKREASMLRIKVSHRIKIILKGSMG